MKAIDYLDRGKTRLDIGQEIADDIGKALRSVTKKIYKEEKRKRKVPSYHYIPTYSGPSLKDTVFDILPEAINNATGGGTYSVSARDLYYVVRPLVGEIVDDKDLQYNYFSQTLLVQYEKEYGPLEGLYRDPRGVLYEPHTGKEIPLGTHQVAAYQFPDWTYNKILYIEKKGVAQQLKPSKLAERYDMAIIAAEGYATEAARTLLENADSERGYHFYVLHDADPYGYNIAYTLQEETRRMPGYSIEVMDLGLDLEEAHNMGLAMEPFRRTNALPFRVQRRLSEFEQQHFIGEMVSRKSWACNRIEINAIPVPERATYIERKLKDFDAPGKVIPPDEKLPELAKDSYEDGINEQVEELVNSILSIDDMKDIVREQFEKRISFENAREWIVKGFKNDDSQLWRNIVRKNLDGFLHEYQDEIRTIIVNEIKGAIH